MGDSSRDTLRGLLVEDPRLRAESAIWSAGSTGLTQAGRALGRPTTTDTTAWRIEARGDTDTALDVQCIRGGVPGSGLGAVWKESTDGSTSYRGQDAPVAIRASETLALGAGGASYEQNSRPDALTMQDGTVVIASEFYSSILALTSVRQVRTRTFSPAGTVAASVAVSGEQFTNELPYPFLIAIPREDGSERILCGQWVEDSATGAPDAANIDLYFSDDRGDTWSVYARSVLTGTTTIDGLSAQRDGINIAGSTGAGSTGWDLRRCRAAYANGQILLMMHLVHHDDNRRRVGDFLFQWQSSDLGATFTIVDEPTDLTATEDESYRGGVPVVRARDGLFHVAYVKVADAAYALGGPASLINVGIQVDRLGAAAQKFTETASADSSNPTLTDGGEVAQVGAALLYDLDAPDCAMALLPSGALAVYWLRPVDVNSGHEIRCAQSSDGVTFTNWGSSMYSTSYGTVWDVDSGATNPLDGGGATGNTVNHPAEIAATGQGGRVAFVTSWVLNGTTADPSLTVLILGGYHSQTLGSTSRSALTRTDAAVGYEQCWFGLHRPDYVAWTRNSTASPTVTFSIDGMQVVCGASDADYWDMTPDGNGLEGLRARWTMKCDTGNTAGDYVAVRVVVRDGTNTIDVSIRYNSTTISVYDNHAAAQIASESVDMTVMQSFELSATVPGSVAGDLVLYRRTATLAADALWTKVADVAPALSSSALALHSIKFGAIAAGITDSTWRDFCFTTHEHTGLRFLDDVAIANPAELQPMTLTGRWSELTQGAFVRSVDGPAAPGDAYSVPLSYGYGGERVLPSVLASPAQGWRSTDENAQSLAWSFNPDTLGTEENAPMGDTWGVHLAGINWGAGTLEGYDVGGASWVTVTALDFTTGASYTRTGNVVELTSASLTQQVRESEYDGGWVDLGGGDLRRITHTRAGLLTSTGGTVRRPRLILADIDGTEGASGSLEIYPRQATVVVRDAASYAGIRVSIDAQSTPDGYFEIGSIVAGPVVVFGTDYSWGRILEQSWNVDLNEARGGQRMPYQVGLPRRSVEVAWTDGVDVTQIDGNDSDADYMLSTSTGGIEPVAYNRDVLYTVQGTVEMLGGPLRPVVYLPALGKGTPDSETLTGRASAVYGRITSPIRLESILGDEEASEVWRLARLTIEEEV
jgi:hypothetical protein